MFKIESYRRGIILSTVFNIFNKGLIFLNGIIVAYFFGADPGTDIYFFVFNTLIILGAFFMNTNSSVIIPESMSIRLKRGQKEAAKFLNFFIAIYLGGAFAGLLITFINPELFFSLISNFNTDKLTTHSILLYLSLPLFAMVCMTTLLTDIMTSYKYFTTPMVIGIVNGLMSILSVLAFHNIIGIESVFYGFLLSYSFNLCLLVYLLKRHLHWKFSMRVHGVPKRIWKNIGFAQVGNLASTLSLFTPMYILSGFTTGMVTALTFAQQISSLPNALITTQFSAVAGIKLNELYSASNFKDINRIFCETADFLHFLTVPISLILFFYSNDLVNILLGFTAIEANIAEHVSFFLKYLGLLLPFHVTNTLISRLFMASHKIKEAFWYQLTFNIIQIILVYSAVKYLGIAGYPLTLIFIYVSNTLASFFLERYFFRFIDYGKVLQTLSKIIIINAIVSTFVFYSIKNIGLANPWATVMTGSIIHLLILMALNHFFKINKQIEVQLKTIYHRLTNTEITIKPNN